ncbi:hypothetical protein LEN26_011519 [Aphanomyces euteiches]|nr:hypothetical protein AeMF1_012395 [Aphanomyces euteiches]KAH9119630.1 hypothetical protein LEN26_011519 [Aphanomyces euteiches]KAH9192871.1 hypothetical protein AeNC1_005153 [Aphanomyces euteiches]
MTNSANAARGRRQVVQLTQEEWLKSLQQQVAEQQKSKPPGRTDHQVGQKDDEEATNRAPVAPVVQVAGGRRRIVQQMTHEEYAKSLQEQIRLKEQRGKEDQIRQEPENMSLASHKEPTQTEGLPPVKGGRRRVQQLSRDEWLASIQQQMKQNEAKSATNSTEQTTQNESTNYLNSPRPNAEETDRIVRLQEAKSSEESHLSMEPDPTTHKEPEEPHGEPEEHPTRYDDNDDKDVDEKLLKAPKGKNTSKEVAKKENKGKTKERREVKGGSKGEDKGEIKKQESKGKAKPAKSAPKPTSRRKSASGNQRSPIKPLPSNQVGSPRQSEQEASKLEHVVQAYEAIQRQNEELKRQLAEQGQVLQFIRESISAPPRETVTPAAPEPPNVVALTPKQQDKLPQKSKLIPPGKIATSIVKRRQVHVKLPAVEPMKPMETRMNNQEPDEIEQCTRELEAPSPAKYSPKVAKDDHSPGPSSVNKLDAKCAQASPSRRRPSKPLKQRQRHDSSTARSSSDLSDMEPELSCSTVLLPALNVPSKSSKGFEPELESESIHVLRESSVMLPIRI